MKKSKETETKTPTGAGIIGNCSPGLDSTEYKSTQTDTMSSIIEQLIRMLSTLKKVTYEKSDNGTVTLTAVFEPYCPPKGKELKDD